MVKSPDMRVLVTGPGCGVQLRGGEHAGRLLFPVYHVTAGFREQSCMVIYSDDHGGTWHLGGGPRYGREIGMMSESQLVELPDGSVQVFARTKAGRVATATARTAALPGATARWCQGCLWQEDQAASSPPSAMGLHRWQARGARLRPGWAGPQARHGPYWPDR